MSEDRVELSLLGEDSGGGERSHEGERTTSSQKKKEKKNPLWGSSKSGPLCIECLLPKSPKGRSVFLPKQGSNF